ncbi:MAG: hypothetical protein R8L53_08295 [Mariprofundales bacterium]
MLSLFDPVTGDAAWRISGGGNGAEYFLRAIIAKQIIHAMVMFGSNAKPIMAANFGPLNTIIGITSASLNIISSCPPDIAAFLVPALALGLVLPLAIMAPVMASTGSIGLFLVNTFLMPILMKTVVHLLKEVFPECKQ